MKTFLALGAALVACAFLAPRSVHAPAQEPERHEAHTVLEDRMHVIEDQIRALRRSLRDETKRDESLAQLALLQEAAVAAKSQSPRMLPRVPEGERAGFVTDYRKEMVGLLQHSLAIERALLEGRLEEARAAFETLRDLEDPAHARFTEEER